MNTPGLHCDHQPIPFDARKSIDVQARNEQAFILEAGRRAIPGEDAHVAGVMRTKAGSPHVDAGVDRCIWYVPADGRDQALARLDELEKLTRP